MTHFPLGEQVVATAAVSHTMEGDVVFLEFVRSCLNSYKVGDDGDLDAHDKQANRAAIRDGSRILASYPLPNGNDWSNGLGDDKLWIITDATVDERRLVTTILWPSDY